MFLTIRRHQKWLFLVIASITIVSFVWYFRPGGKNANRASGAANYGSISGEPIADEDYRSAVNQAQLSYFLNRGEWPDDASAKQAGFDLEREIYQHLFLSKKMQELNIHISREAVGITAGQILRSFGRENGPIPLATFDEKILRPHGLAVKDLNDFIEYELGLRQLMNTLGLTGKLTTEAEAEMLFRREHEELTTEAVFFHASAYTNAVPLDPARIGQFYTNQMARYRIADRRQVTYVKFALADHNAAADKELAAITNLTDRIDGVYAQRGTNFYKDITAADAKKQIRDEFRKELALRAARNAAAAFTEDLLNLTPVSPDNLAKLAADRQLTAAVTAPFTSQAGPVELNVTPNFARAAFARTADEPFDGPVIAEDGVYVIALKKTIPSEIPTLDAIRDNVTADYQFIEAATLARAAGADFAAKLAAGKSFADVCADAKVKAVKLPAFSLASRSIPEIEQLIPLGRLQEIAYGLPAGGHSGFIPGNEGGLVVHLLSRQPVTDAAVKTELPAFLRQVRQTRQNEAFGAWFNREASVALRDTPIARQQPK